MTPQLAFPLLRVANRAGFVTCSTRGRLGGINLGITPRWWDRGNCKAFGIQETGAWY